AAYPERGPWRDTDSPWAFPSETGDSVLASGLLRPFRRGQLAGCADYANSHHGVLNRTKSSSCQEDYSPHPEYNGVFPGSRHKAKHSTRLSSCTLPSRWADPDGVISGGGCLERPAGMRNCA